MKIEELKDCKTKLDLIQFARTIPETKYNKGLVEKIRSAKTLNDALEITWNVALQSEGKYFLGREVSGKWGKIGYKATGYLMCRDK